jgi:hypothetical protein
MEAGIFAWSKGSFQRAGINIFATLPSSDQIPEQSDQSKHPIPLVYFSGNQSYTTRKQVKFQFYER